MFEVECFKCGDDMIITDEECLFCEGSKCEICEETGYLKIVKCINENCENSN